MICQCSLGRANCDCGLCDTHGYPDTIPTDFDALTKAEQEDARGSVQMLGGVLLWTFCVICIGIPLAIHFWQRAQ